jgi:cyclin-dependent kinase 12/13
MVFEYIEHDLAGLLDARVPFTENNVKSLMKQLLEALHQCHSVNILHRDLKASNLLITQQGVLKLADFGLSRFMQQGKNRYTNRVITRWYRPPELLLGATEYSTKIDMWSVGCILGEILLAGHKSSQQKTVFPGSSDLDQLELIFQICGTPTMESWADVSKLPMWKDFKPQKEYKRVLREKFRDLPYSEDALDLLDRLLVLDPEKRLSARECLTHDWFWKGGDPERPTR